MTRTQDSGWLNSYRAYTHAGAINHLTFLLAVDDMNLQNGCLEVVPGSHRETIPLGDNKLSSSLHQAGTSVSVGI